MPRIDFIKVLILLIMCTSSASFPPPPPVFLGETYSRKPPTHKTRLPVYVRTSLSSSRGRPWLFAHKGRTNRQEPWASVVCVTVGHKTRSPMHVTTGANKGLRHASGLGDRGIGDTNSVQTVTHTRDLTAVNRGGTWSGVSAFAP